MNLRKKTYLLTTLAVAAATGGLLGAIEVSVRLLLSRIEKEQTLHAASAAKSLVERKLLELRQSLRSAAVEHASPIAGNSSDHTEQRPRPNADHGVAWDTLLRINPAGEIVAGEPIDSKGVALIRSEVSAADLKGKGTEGAQLINLSGRPALLAYAQAVSIPAGVDTLDRWAAVHFLNPSDFDQIKATTGVSVILRSSFESAAISGTPNLGRQAGGGEQDSRLILREPKGFAIASVEFVPAEELRRDVLKGLYLWMALIVAVALALCASMDRWVIRPVTRRLARVGYGLLGIQRTGNLNTRIEIEGSDEIATLAREANRLLASAEVSQRTLERVNAEMQQRVAERTAALADANAALEADIAERIKAEQEREQLREQLLQAHKMEAVGTLAGGIAHDFNNILTGILGHAQLMAADLSPESPARRNLGHVISAAERASSLVRQILAFSRQTPGERRPIAVSQVVRETLALLRAALPSGIAIRFEKQTSLDVVDADATQLHQVFMNLGANAGHAIGSRDGELSVRVERMVLKAPKPGLVRALAPGEYVCISFLDTGCGMSPEVMERIFDPFFSTKPVDQGTGLGLAVVHGIITDHGGTIEVDSEVGRGTCFKIWLPGAAKQVGVVGETTADPLPGNESVLLVDDEELVLSVMSNSLRRLGYSTTTELSGPAALERFKESPQAFDLVITDQTMPHMSGLQLNTAIKAIRPEIPVILVTGYSPEVAGREPEALGVAGIIGKPINFSELTGIIRKELDRKNPLHGTPLGAFAESR